MMADISLLNKKRIQLLTSSWIFYKQKRDFNMKPKLTITINFNNMPSVVVNRNEGDLREAIINAIDTLSDSSIEDIDMIDVRDSDQLMLFPEPRETTDG